MASKAPVAKAAVRPAAKTVARSAGEVRIIGGQWKRSKLPVADQPGLRPTPDRVRETLFNWLGQDLTGWSCVDVFAGTGALGFEAASRGARAVTLIEQDSTLVAQLKKIREQLQASAVQVQRGEGIAALGEAFGERSVTPRVERIREALAEADVQAEASADIRVPLWEKLIFLAPIAGLTAVARLPVGPAWAHAEFRDAYDRAAAEIEAVARHEGVAVAGDVREQKHRYLDNSPAGMRTSMMVDVAAGRPLELEALLGTVVRRGRAAGIPTPVVATLYGALKPLERGGSTS